MTSRDPFYSDRSRYDFDEAYVQSCLETIAYDSQMLIDAEERARKAQRRLPGDAEIDGEVETPHLTPHMKGWLDEQEYGRG
jgi:hypothetical protein